VPELAQFSVQAGQPGLLQHPQRVQLADRLDDPRQHQLSEHLITAAGLVKAQDPAGMLQGTGQAAHPRGGKPATARRPRQYPGPGQTRTTPQLAAAAPRPSAAPARPHHEPADVLDLPRPPAPGVHDLHRRGARPCLDRPYVRHPVTLGPRISVQIQFSRTDNVQVTASRQPRTRNREPTQD